MANEPGTAPNNMHGTPSWLEHSSGDPKAAREFYEAVLGITVADLPMKDGSNYAVIMVGEQPVGGFAPAPANGPGDRGWLSYITVDDVDARVEKAKSNGATIVSEAMTAPGVGRMATIKDPFGATIALIDYSKA